MTNLLRETLAVLKDDPSRVVWVGSADGAYALSWEDFAKISDVEYDAGYGAQEIADDLVVVLADGTWLQRTEYDGSEGWEHRAMPRRQPDAVPFSQVKVPDDKVGWESLHAIQPEDMRAAQPSSLPD